MDPSPGKPHVAPVVHAGHGLFGPEPLRGNPASLLLSAEGTVTWDRSDLFLVIADEEKKAECDSIPPIERVFSTSQTCKAEDTGYEAISHNGSAGLRWTAQDGAYYVGIGTLGESNPEGDAFTLSVSIELGLSATGYVATLLLGGLGVWLIKLD